MRFDIERTSTAVCRRRVMRVTPCFVGVGSGICVPPAIEGGGEGAGDDVGANGRNAAREKAEEVRKRWNGSGSDIANTCDEGRYSFTLMSSPRDVFARMAVSCSDQSSLNIADGCVKLGISDVGRGSAGRERGR